ncbi:MAG: hypothetical protein KUL82_08920 [Bdellovibrio sp.]|nr:hypothetical protein [Bdellovibrio sp.]
MNTEAEIVTNKHEGHCESDAGQHLIQQGHKLQRKGEELLDKAKHLTEEGNELIKEGKELVADGDRIAREHCAELEKLHIFVNRIRFGKDKGVKKKMTVNEIAQLVGLTAETAVVRRLDEDGNASQPLHGTLDIESGEQFSVTRKNVNGGSGERVKAELDILREGRQKAQLIDGFVLYEGVPAWMSGPLKTDVIVPIPNGYPSSMIDRAGLPVGSPLIGKVKGQPQEVVQVGGKAYQLISYHPHNGGGGQPWNLSVHGFHTYLTEVIAWLEVA